MGKWSGGARAGGVEVGLYVRHRDEVSDVQRRPEWMGAGNGRTLSEGHPRKPGPEHGTDTD